MLKARAQTQPLLMLLLLALKIATVIAEIETSEWKGPPVDGKVGEGRCTGARYFYAPVAVRLVCPDKGCMRSKQDGECSIYNTFRLCKDTMYEMGYTCDPAVHVLTAAEKDCLRWGEPKPFYMIAPKSTKGEVANTTAFFCNARRHDQQDFWLVDDMEIGKDKCAVQYTNIMDTDHYHEEPWLGDHPLRGNTNAMTDGYIKNELPMPDRSKNIRVGVPFVHSVSYPARKKCYSRSTGEYFPMYIRVDYIILYTYMVWGPGTGDATYSGVMMGPKSLTSNDLKHKLYLSYIENVDLTSESLGPLKIERVNLGHHRPIYHKEHGEGASYSTRRCNLLKMDYDRCNTRIFIWTKDECSWMKTVERPHYCGKACDFLRSIWKKSK